MDMRYLDSFVAVVESGSLAEAARLLDLTPAAIAARIRALEQDLGTVLIKRSGRSVRPTEAGAKVVDRARAVLRDVRDLRTMAGDRAALGELRLGVFMSAMIGVLPPLLTRLYAKHPDLPLFVGPGHSIALCKEVATGALDAAIVVEPQFALPKHCSWQSLMEEPLVVVAPKALAGHDAHELLSTQPFIRYDRAVLGGQLADRYLRDHGIRPRQRLEIDGLMAIAALVGEGLGVALMPDWIPMWTSGLEIARIALPERAPFRRVGLVWAHQGPRAALVRDLLTEAEALFAKPGIRNVALRKR